MAEGTLPRRATGNTMPGRTESNDTDLDAAPPAYGEHHDQLQFSQSGFAADAAVTADGRVNIHINEKNRRLSELLGPALKRQLLSETKLPSGPLPPAYIPPSLGGQPGQTPPPRLNVVIQIVGSRGDVQPFVALGQVLRDTYGHRVRVATHANFRTFVEENGLEFFNIGGDPAQLMAFMVKNPGLMPGLDTLKSGDIKKRRQEIQEILVGCWRSCIEAGDGMGVAPPQHKRDEPVDERFVLPGDSNNRPFVADAIIANPPSFAHVHIAEKMGIPLHMMFTMPWTPTRAFPHPLADVIATNADAAITNYVSYALVEMMTWQGLGDVINRFRTSILELDPISLLWAPGLLNRLRIPATYCWSPALTPKPADWMPEITVSGFYFLNLESNYNPEPELAAFLAAGPPPVYIGFGSIVVDEPDALTKTIFDAVIKSGVRALVSKGWGGIGGDSAGIPEGIFMLGNCPHDWLFKRVSAVVHHGGAGTTAAGILAGKPTVVVPFFGDQIFWGSMIAKAGAGPAPIPYKKLGAENLADAIQFALQPDTQARAQELGTKIKQEKGADVGGKSFHQFLNTDNMRCSLAPSRVAVWRVRRSKIRLSALAAAVLVKQGWLKYSDLKLYRAIEYNTDEQPWDPISAVILAFVGDVGAFTMAVADFPREVFKGAKKDKGKASTKDETAKTDDATSIAASGTSLGDGSSSHHQPTDSGSDTPNLSSPGTAHGSVEALSIQSPTLASDTAISPQPSRALGTPPTLPPRTPSHHRTPSNNSGTSSPNPVNLDVAVAAGKGVGRIVGAGMKFYANTCLGLARGFRNAPKLYNDETVRPPEKVTGLVSGMRVAGKEFGFGMYDGISGLVTQPWKGAEKEGGVGFVKGFGKGIGGLVLKNASAFFAIPAYTVQGMRKEVRNYFARSSMNYIITSRVLQGEEDLTASTPAEREDVLARWHTQREDLKGFYLLKQREGERAAAAAVAAAAASIPPTTASSASSDFSFEDNEALERAIQQSVVQTSTGDREEDARIEAAVRASVMGMRRAAAAAAGAEQLPQSQSRATPSQNPAGWIADQKVAPVVEAAAAAGNHVAAVPGAAVGELTDEEWTNISDEEYQALIEEAVRQSMLQQETEQHHHHEPTKAAEAGRGVGLGVVNQRGEENDDDDEDEEQLRRAMEESEREHRGLEESMARQRTEEEIVLEYVKKQSLAEEEFRRRAGEEGKGKGVSPRGGGEEDDEEDEDLRRAIEESLRVGGGGGGGGGPSGSKREE
ncbi:glycosyltransferase [Chaetomidium leptoderma]|uniref:Glycosyltransferase n=1 Tax=Chaetomidium leptoderma TaxID=669021 RepID=A0AAN7A0R3_9PEZI|nr:glycosyltransferase [Chaetomidium leptoderma]